MAEVTTRLRAISLWLHPDRLTGWRQRHNGQDPPAMQGERGLNQVVVNNVQEWLVGHGDPQIFV